MKSEPIRRSHFCSTQQKEKSELGIKKPERSLTVKLLNVIII